MVGKVGRLQFQHVLLFNGRKEKPEEWGEGFMEQEADLEMGRKTKTCALLSSAQVAMMIF